MNKQKGFTHILILLVLVIVLGIFGVRYLTVNKNAPKTNKPTTTKSTKTSIKCDDFGFEACPTHKGCEIACTSSIDGSCSCTGEYHEYTAIENCLLKTYSTKPLANPKGNKLEEYGVYISQPFYPTPNLEAATECFAKYPNSSFYGYLQFAGPNTNEQENLSKNLGLERYQAVRNFTFQTKFPASLEITNEAKKQIRWIGVVETEHKVPEDLWKGKIGDWALTDDGKVKLRVMFYEGVDETTVQKILSQNEAVVLNSYELGRLIYQVKAPRETIKTLASENIVSYIETVPPPPQVE